MGNYGIKISRKGKSVYAATDSELNYDSQKNTWKYAQEFSGTTTITLGEGETSGSVNIDLTHNLGYSPQLLGFFKTETDLLLYPVGIVMRIPGQMGYVNVDPFYDTIQSGYVPGENTSTISFEFLQGILIDPPTTEISIDYVAYILIEPDKDPWYE